MKKETCAERLKKAMEIRNMKQVDLINITKIKKSALSQYVSGKILPRQNNLYKLAEALDVNEAWLMGYDVEMERRSYISEKALEKIRTAARNEKMIINFNKLSEKRKQAVETLINSFFDEDMEDEE